MKYFMSEKTARFVRGMMEQANTPKSVATGAARRVTPSDVVEDSFAHPFELRWAASSGEGGAGAWVVWLPPGSPVTDGTEASTADLTAAAGYPAGWYDLTSIFGEAEVPESFDLFLDVGEKIKFTIDRAAATNPVLVASVTGKTVKCVVESALVFSASSRRPFDIETVESGEASVRKIVRCSFWIMGQYVTLEDYTLPEMVEEEGGENPDVRVVVIFNAPAAGDIDKSNPGQYCSIGTEADLPSGDEAADRVISTLRLYDFTAGGAVKMDWRDVPVRWQFWYVDDNTISVDEDTAKSGQFHLKQFYGNERNLTTIPAAGATVSFLVRYANASDGGDFKLCYLSPDGLKDFLGVSGGSGGGGEGEGDEGGEGGETECVESLNGGTGAMSIVAGEGISVAVEKGVITITNTKPCNCKEGEDEGGDSGPSDPCAHPESGEEGDSVGSGSGDAVPGESGGVPAVGGGEGGWWGGIVGGGGLGSGWNESGVAAGGDSHSGSNDCCTE